MATLLPLIPDRFRWAPAEWTKEMPSLTKLGLPRYSVTDTAASLPSLPLFLEAKAHATRDPNKIAIIDRTKSESFTYAQLLADVSTLKRQILGCLTLESNGDLDEQRIAFLAPAGYDYVVIQWAIWAAGGVCVPMCKPCGVTPTLRYFDKLMLSQAPLIRPKSCYTP